MMRFSYANPKEIVSGLKHIWESETGFPPSTRIIKDIDRALEEFEIVYCAHGADVEGLEYQNRHRQPVVVDAKSLRWGGARSKGGGASAILNGRRYCTVIC